VDSDVFEIDENASLLEWLRFLVAVGRNEKVKVVPAKEA